MSIPSVETATESDRDTIIPLITLGFSADPITRWVWPDAKLYLEAMPKFVEAFGGRAFASGTAWYADGYRAAALWLPPGVEPDTESIIAVMEQTMTPEIVEDAVSLFGKMAEFHPRDQPCWFLPMIAADPTHMGRGLGSALMKHALRRCDEAGQIAYLESSNPRNLSLYQRHGFEVMDRIQVGSSPAVHPMIRQARR